MFSLGPLRYRNVLAAFGGPIDHIECGLFSVRGKELHHANAYLVRGHVPKKPVVIYSDADGTGTHNSAAIARYMAVSEALERWAHSEILVKSHGDRFGFDVDPSSNGMAAFPGVIATQARKHAKLEAIERFSILGWWEGALKGELVDTTWPGIRALIIDAGLGSVAAIAFGECALGQFAYGTAAGDSITNAIAKAVTELARHEYVIKAWASAGPAKQKPTTKLERRALFFSTPAGFGYFEDHLRRGCSANTARFEVICDCEIPGPWSRFANVWRVAFRPHSDAFLAAGEDYFYW